MNVTFRLATEGSRRSSKGRDRGRTRWPQRTSARSAACAHRSTTHFLKKASRRLSRSCGEFERKHG